MIMKKSFRILASPFIYTGYLALCIGSLVFPGTIMMMFAFMLLFKNIGVSILNLMLENEIKKDEPFINNTGCPFIDNNHSVGHFLTFTFIIWLPFYFTYRFIKLGKLG